MLCIQRKAHRAQRTGEWAIIEGYLPGSALQKIGILLSDTRQDSLYMRLRPRWWRGVVDEEEAEIWSELSEDLTQRAQEIGAAELLDWLENSASHAIRISRRQQVRFSHAESTVDTLYRQHLRALDTALELTQPKRALKRSLHSNRLIRPAILAGISAALAAALLLVVQSPGHKGPVAHVNVSAYRDAENEVIPEKRPVRITVGPVDLPDGPVVAQIVNNSVSEVWAGNAAVSHQYVQIFLPRIEGRGMHLLRLYSPSTRYKHVEPLAEFPFLVANENGTSN